VEYARARSTLPQSLSFNARELVAFRLGSIGA
jgi:hypothetical protein